MTSLGKDEEIENGGRFGVKGDLVSPIKAAKKRKRAVFLVRCPTASNLRYQKNRVYYVCIRDIIDVKM